MTTTVPAAALRDFMTRALRQAGLPEPDAASVAGLMLEADLVGADAHGIFRLPQYVQRLAAGGVNARPSVRGGPHRPGHRAGRRRQRDGPTWPWQGRGETAIALAKECGVAWVGTTRSNHAGPASIYAAMPVAAGMVGLYSAVASANHMAPWGGTDLLLGTNPLSIGRARRVGAPGDPRHRDDRCVVRHDQSYALRGVELAEGWMVDRQTGAPLTDPARTAEGVLLPIGGYKGAGLALVLGLLAGTLNGAGVGADVVDFNADDSTAANTGQFVIALDIARFTDPSRFAAAVDRHVRELQGSARLPGVESIRLPASNGRPGRARRSGEGVPIPAAVLARLDALGARLGHRPRSAESRRVPWSMAVPG